jgi:hypothetical protein
MFFDKASIPQAAGPEEISPTTWKCTNPHQPVVTNKYMHSHRGIFE